ncbi:MAG: hypothetical protein AAFU64_12610 [Bacteroidota bacterium]
MKNYYLLGVLLMGLGFSACDNPNLDWEPEILAPLVFGQLNINSQPALRNGNYSTLTNLDLGLSGVVTPVPAFSGLSTSSGSLRIDNPPIVEIGIDTLIIQGTISNPLGIQINAGAVISLRNTDDQSLIASHTVASDIDAFGTYDFTELVTAGVARLEVEVIVDNISSPGSTTPVNVSNSSFRFDLNFDFQNISYIIYPANTQSEFLIENDFNIDISEDLENITGSLFLVTDNAIALNFDLQVFFLDANGNTIITLAPFPIQIPAGTAQNPTEQIDEINDASVLNSLLNVESVRIRAIFDTFGASNDVRIEGTDNLDFKITGNLRLIVETN